ncbi:transglutaminase family protein [Magnetospirillum molischianum]|uniref:Protein SirB1 N-terminal domain-containing protein n=1 Tax=Magnetospirillum molischianum DSM 120 TaxID=1150626 RepID=H8FTM1_MAGML|nr:transglutaminase-like domain-containing protein [Magnetospirillum molischianum]CCG41709.1 conserved hypothetical protein [Magnetospirillum molischianum DSM 120]
MTEAAGLRRRLADLGRQEDAAIAPVEAALWLAALVRPGVIDAIPTHLDTLSTLADTVRAAAWTDESSDPAVERHAAALTGIVLRRHGFQAILDSEDDDHDLGTVLERRCGDPDSLGLVMLDIARRAGLTAEALAFPCRLLLRIEDETGRRLILDPTDATRRFDTPDLRALLKAVRGLSHELEPSHFVALDNRALLVRVQTTVKQRLLRLGRLDRALTVVEGLLLVAPDLPPLWREAGLMHLRQGNPRGAVAALEQFVIRTSDIQARARALSLMAELKSRPH